MTKAVELLKRALESIKLNNEAIGGCDHSVGICNCADIDLADQIDAYLKGQAACEAKECSYYRHYLAYGPADLTHEGYHAAEEHCQRAQERVDAWMKKHPDAISLAACPYWPAAEAWERRVRA